jgi:hypothetical protein
MINTMPPMRSAREMTLFMEGEAECPGRRSWMLRWTLVTAVEGADLMIFVVRGAGRSMSWSLENRPSPLVAIWGLTLS